MLGMSGLLLEPLNPSGGFLGELFPSPGVLSSLGVLIFTGMPEICSCHPGWSLGLFGVSPQGQVMSPTVLS